MNESFQDDINVWVLSGGSYLMNTWVHGKK